MDFYYMILEGIFDEFFSFGIGGERVGVEYYVVVFDGLVELWDGCGGVLGEDGGGGYGG